MAIFLILSMYLYIIKSVNAMFKYIITVLTLIPFMSFSQSHNEEDKIFLQYYEQDGYLVGFSPSIQVVDVDNDLAPEIEILIFDTLNIIKGTEITKYFAFNQPISQQEPDWILLCKNENSGNPKFYSINRDFILPHWSSFEPITNSWTYGTLNEPIEHSSMINIDPLGNFWASFYDYENNELGFLKMSDLNSLADTIAYIGENDSLFHLGSGMIGYSPIYISRNGQFISTIQAGEHIFTSGNPGGLYYFHSSDFGANWQGKDIARGSYNNPVFGQVTNRNLAPFFVGPTTYAGVIDDTGILHFAIYGYGLTPEGSDTIKTTSILYWNSRDENWIAITDPIFESNKDAAGNLLEDYTPGWISGQSLPSISITPDGSIVLVSWTSQEYEGEPGTSSYNIYPGDGGPYSAPVYYTNVLANISYDGGRTWSKNNIFSLEANKNYSESCASLYPYLLTSENNSLKLHYYFLVDLIPGWIGFGQNSQSDNECYYNTYSFPITGTKSELASVFEFKLEQNYPNPFNPTTKIRWEIPSMDRATIKIFNILGEEINTLIDKVIPAGKYEIVFNGRGFASGVYFYQLKSGNYVTTKKMILLR